MFSIHCNSDTELYQGEVTAIGENYVIINFIIM
jgi:hypothetical protein